jgi:a disintegrin and metalloproteinase with thrombospondin motifs 7
LNNKPFNNDYNYTFPSLPGLAYDFDNQCQFSHGKNAHHCNDSYFQDPKEQCSVLWCRIGESSSCLTKYEQVADGTLCGTDDINNLWCLNGKCVHIEPFDRSIDGGWGEWSNWTDCNRRCNIGVQYKDRQCNNPAPRNHGKYCIGQKREYRLCNTHKCLNSKKEDQHFKNQQCSKFDGYNLNEIGRQSYEEWEYYFYSYEPCKLYCLLKGTNKYFVKNPTVTDGTPCYSPFSKESNNICIHGACQWYGCDWIIGSETIEDVCGVCGGNNSTCHKIVQTFYINHTQNYGYIKLVTIPSDARSLLVETEYGNYLAVSDSSQKYHLNGNFQIVLNSNFKINDINFEYKNDGTKQSINTKGPIKNDINLMMLCIYQNSTIKISYTLPNSMNDSLNELENITNPFHWVFIEEDDDWSSCSVSCGKGFKIKKPKCLNDKNEQSNLCNEESRPENRIKYCNVFECSPDWLVEEWQMCSAYCKSTNESSTGSRKRSIHCVVKRPNYLNDEIEIVTLPETKCDLKSRPITAEYCKLNCTNQFKANSLTGYWIIESQWTNVF